MELNNASMAKTRKTANVPVLNATRVAVLASAQFAMAKPNAKLTKTNLTVLDAARTKCSAPI